MEGRSDENPVLYQEFFFLPFTTFPSRYGKKNSTKLNVSCTKLLWWKLIFELEGGINFSEEEGLRAHMRFSLATTSVGEGKKSDQHSKNRDPLKEN